MHYERQIAVFAQNGGITRHKDLGPREISTTKEVLGEYSAGQCPMQYSRPDRRGEIIGRTKTTITHLAGICRTSASSCVARSPQTAPGNRIQAKAKMPNLASRREG